LHAGEIIAMLAQPSWQHGINHPKHHTVNDNDKQTIPLSFSGSPNFYTIARNYRSMVHGCDRSSI